ncbi:hypothetical protein CA13_24430 [Planctomycetes bacterium CA13]|uniref:Uncharacterized protein n=1 Tax=Novipirellula herctigrandis TaxID=2527986 RepID=A0A5C5Z1W2_9BACT|nr:hypothetical protein CA13_24430 [Planctomycetes bacterium CA13]
MATDTDPKPLVPMMGAEGGFAPDEEIAPFRISGLFCLLFGVLSIFSLIAYVMIAFPLIAIALGLFALRKWDGPRPSGVALAKIGLVLALGFGSCAAWMHQMRSRTLGSQAEYFAKQYIELLANDQIPIAAELRKDYVNRAPTHMPLKQHMESNEMGRNALDDLRGDSANLGIGGPDNVDAWVPAKPTRVYYNYGNYKAEVLLKDSNNPEAKKIIVLLKYDIDPDGNGQWLVEQCRQDMKKLVAEAVL